MAYTVESVESDPDTRYPRLDCGESAALLLCQQHGGLLLTDDLDARRIAADEGVEVHGSVGVILLASNLGERSETGAKQVLRDLERDTNLYFSAPLIEHALALVDSDDAGW